MFPGRLRLGAIRACRPPVVVFAERWHVATFRVLIASQWGERRQCPILLLLHRVAEVDFADVVHETD